jgi:hypothetical protein
MPDEKSQAEPKQKTPKGAVIPVPSRQQVLAGLKKIATSSGPVRRPKK